MLILYLFLLLNTSPSTEREGQLKIRENKVKMWRKIVLGLCLATGLLLTFLMVYSFRYDLRTKAYARFVSPSGEFTVVVHKKILSLSMRLPGHGSDTPGVVLLLDKNKKILRRGNVEMIGMITAVTWSEGYVSIPTLGRWYLPFKKTSQEAE